MLVFKVCWIFLVIFVVYILELVCFMFWCKVCIKLGKGGGLRVGDFKVGLICLVVFRWSGFG